MPKPVFQTVQMRNVDRSDHVWNKQVVNNRVRYKCCLCGGISHEKPPDSPTPEDWMPEKYEALTEEERDLARRPYAPRG